MGEWGAMPPWVWIVIVAILVSGFRRRWYYRPRSEPQVPEREDPRVDDLQARVAELENRLDFTERLLSSRSTSENEATLSESGRRGP
ncbi:MAG TPA: hypothetical protein VLB12_16010 [Gemmatimonadales bacterium]|nr:hypothetical protein [Gemmatimonadales bacterium]